MENYQGDLTDILRASSGGLSSNTTAEVSPITDWQFPGNPIEYPSGIEEPLDEFGDPFSNMQDPLLHEMHMSSGASVFFSSSNNTSTEIISSCVENTSSGIGGCDGGGSSLLTRKILDEDEIRRPAGNNIFSRMLQISPSAKMPVSPRDSQVVAASPRGLKPPPTLLTNEMINCANSSKGSLVENAGMQISSPRNTGIKRRKSQAKKVVCIPAPAPANSRSSGEIVPSDLWAWRKYGQKPIKGSPYPRGYYRCSSSKGCSARKQVERSRTDPNMLVITYTSEHNHPWPTQRNALAGSTRSQPAKNGSTSKTSTSSQAQKATTLKDEEREKQPENVSSPIITGSSNASQPVKEEMEDLDKQMEMDDVQFDGFPQSYKPALPDSNHSEDFFADLGELEADPLNLLFTQGYSGDVEHENKNLDPFSFYDWTSNNTTTKATTTTTTTTTATITASVDEAKKGL
ncbi:hypothetical protein ACH5RR_015751 [Cinchona calisaya]|uniref:WRKY domain-containing protein n=1 Tax=Cinchona calisaya TaxID=153742 RepID=A0ABD2ZXM7_9GENT